MPNSKVKVQCGITALFLVVCLASPGVTRAADAPRATRLQSRDGRALARPRPPRLPTARVPTSDVKTLRDQIARQQEQIDQLRAALDEQKKLLERTLHLVEAARISRPEVEVSSELPQISSLAPVIPTGRTGADVPAAPFSPATVPAAGSAAPVSQQELHEYTAKVDDLNKKVEGGLKNLGGFKFSGDFRFRFDAQLRSSNNIAGPLQNIRSRYRLRFNIDKELDPRLRFHMQLSTGPYQNGLTNDQDFAGIVAKHPFSVAEAYVDFRPNSTVSLRGGRMEEIFADNMRYLWDDDVRFNGFHQTLSFPIESNSLGIKHVEFRAAEYILTNPNVAILSPTVTPSGPFFVSAGYQPGHKVGDANLFHPGFVVKGDLGPNWTHQFTSDMQIYRNQNQIQLASTGSGFYAVVNNAIGLVLSGPTTGSGNCTSTPGGAIYCAPHFQIARVDYRLEHQGWKLGDRAMPFWLDFQASRNVGTSKLRDAFMTSANLGAVKGPGDMRFLYQFTIKDANSLISQFTDDDLGIGTGVNVSVHAVRFDVGLTRFLQWQNLLFVQHVRRPSNPEEQFFVPLQRGANTTLRYLGQMAFTF